MYVRQIPFLQVQPNYYYKQKIHQIIKRSQMPQHDRFEQNGIKHQERSPALSIIIPKISSQTRLQRLLFLQLLCNCWEKQQSFWILWQDNKKLHLVKWYETRRIKNNFILSDFLLDIILNSILLYHSKVLTQ